jgi:hypothetical protein
MTRLGRSPRTARIAAFGLIVAALFVVARAWQPERSHAGGRARDAEPSAEAWPPFTMLMRDMGPGTDPQRAIGRRLRVDYVDRTHFRVVDLGSDAEPDAIGSTWTVDGDRAVYRDLRGGRVTVTEYRPEEWPRVPDHWLVPGEARRLADEPGWRALPGEDGKAILVRDEVVDGRREREEIVYRTADGIPTDQVLTVDGALVRRLEVERGRGVDELDVGEHVATEHGVVISQIRRIQRPPATMPDSARIGAQRLTNGWWYVTVRDVELPCETVPVMKACGAHGFVDARPIRILDFCFEPATLLAPAMGHGRDPDSTSRGVLESCAGKEADAPRPRRAQVAPTVTVPRGSPPAPPMPPPPPRPSPRTAPSPAPAQVP